MSRQTTSSSKNAVAPVNPTTKPASPNGSVDYEEVARLAYSYWQARGCPNGSPEEDWFRAAQDLSK